MDVLILDGPIGTELLARGVPTPLPGWSAHALDDAPDVVTEIHRDYATAGARVHTTNTFRTRRAVFAERWEQLARRAVRLARAGAAAGDRVAGCIAPLRDCYRPDLSPAAAARDATLREHGELARTLVDAGVDLLLCETFPHVGEALLATQAARAAGADVWTSFTPGPDASLLTPAQVVAGGREAVALGASAVLVNCLPVSEVERYATPLVEALGADVRIGAYANAGRPDAAVGWASDPGWSAAYADHAARWVAAGVSIVGGCCGTGPSHVAAVSRRLATGPASS